MAEFAAVFTSNTGRGNRIITISLQSCLACMFVTAGVTKLLMLDEESLGFIFQFGFESVSAQRVMFGVALVELVVGVWLVSGFRAGLAALTTITLLALFQIAIIWMGLRFGWDRNCPCGLGVFSLRWATARNAVCAMACVILIRLLAIARPRITLGEVN